MRIYLKFKKQKQWPPPVFQPSVMQAKRVAIVNGPNLRHCKFNNKHVATFIVCPVKTNIVLPTHHTRKGISGAMACFFCPDIQAVTWKLPRHENNGKIQENVHDCGHVDQLNQKKNALFFHCVICINWHHKNLTKLITCRNEAKTNFQTIGGWVFWKCGRWRCAENLVAGCPVCWAPALAQDGPL